MNGKFEPIKFENWQELAKFVIDGGEVYFESTKIVCDEGVFNLYFTEHLMSNLCIKKQPTLEELIAIKPRLCWVWDDGDTTKEVVRINKIENNIYYNDRCWWRSAQMLTDDEIKQFLSDGE